MELVFPIDVFIQGIKPECFVLGGFSFWFCLVFFVCGFVWVVCVGFISCFVSCWMAAVFCICCFGWFNTEKA